MRNVFSYLLPAAGFIGLASFGFQDEPTFKPSDKEFIVGATMTRYNIGFGGGDCQTEVSSGQKTLDSLYLMLKSRPYIKMEIGVHEGKPCKGCKKCNPSQNAADAIRDYLVKKSIDKSRLSTVGYGMTMPLLNDTTGDGKPTEKAARLNERVVFKITYSKY
ncbi:MAG: OmpA family protein [Bacteroidota bacterium]